MGQSKSVFTEQELTDYADLTYFTRKEVLKWVKIHVTYFSNSFKRTNLTKFIYFNIFRYFHQFKALAPDLISVQRDARLPMEVILRYPQLRYNPFGDRICMVFSSNHDGDCNFEDFLDMLSVFSELAPISLKAEYAFRIYGKTKQLSPAHFNDY